MKIKKNLDIRTLRITHDYDVHYNIIIHIPTYNNIIICVGQNDVLRRVGKIIIIIIITRNDKSNLQMSLRLYSY